MTEVYSRLKDSLSNARRRVITQTDLNKYSFVERDFDETDGFGLSGFFSVLRHEQRVVVALSALERCEYLSGLVGVELNVSRQIDGWLKNRKSVDGEDVRLNDLIGRVQNSGLTGDSYFAGLHSLRCALASVYTVTSLDGAFYGAEAVKRCASAFRNYTWALGGSSAEGFGVSKKSISDVVNRALCRLAFKDAERSVLL